MRELIISKLRKKVLNDADSKYTKKLDIEPSKSIPLLNSRCQFNAVHSVKQGDAVAVIECALLSHEEGEVSAHYISLMSDDTIFDYTLGWAWSGGDYRFIRYVPDSEYGTINDSLGNLKESLCGKLPWYCWLFNINKWDLC